VIEALEGQGVTTELVRVAWTYWNMGPGPGPSYTETDQGHDWSISTGKAAAGNLAAVARALQANPIPPPPGS
jgi:hypothetical protein